MSEWADLVKRAALVCLPLLLLAGPARAYVRTTTQHDDPTVPSVPVQWNVRCLVVQPDSRGSKDVSMADEEKALQESIEAWSAQTSSCGGLSLSSAPPDGVLEVGDDGRQALIFRNDSWQRPGHEPYDPAAIALTTVMYIDTPGRVGDGTLTDADIEVNNVDFDFTVDADATTQNDGTINLVNTLTHELGHVQGLAHTCWDHVTATAPLDDTGLPIPDCADPDLPQSIVETIMYPYYTGQDASDRPLTTDDIDGVCQVYGPISAKMACYLDVENEGIGLGGGCQLAGGDRFRRDRSGWLAALAAALLMISRLRRRVRRHP